jgi:hypothetical protein
MNHLSLAADGSTEFQTLLLGHGPLWLTWPRHTARPHHTKMLLELLLL